MAIQPSSEPLDFAIAQFDRALRTLFAPATSQRPIPGEDLPNVELSDPEKRHSAALMRVNHCGEICAQALYQGQAWTSHSPVTVATLEQACREETEHLAWTERRIADLGGRQSLLNPFWYAGALVMGMVAGRLSDPWNLGFLAETERQVEAHLKDHMSRLPPDDHKSRAVVDQMKTDEARHGDTAVNLGGRDLPLPVRVAMKLASRVMTRTAYWI